MSLHDTIPGRVHTDTGPLIRPNTCSNLRGPLVGFHSRVQPPTPHRVVQRNVAQHVARPRSTLSGSGVPRNFVWGGGQQIQLRTEDRENGDLGAVAP